MNSFTLVGTDLPLGKLVIVVEMEVSIRGRESMGQSRVMERVTAVVIASLNLPYYLVYLSVSLSPWLTFSQFLFLCLSVPLSLLNSLRNKF